MEFVYTGNPSRVIFGSGSRRQIAEELDRLEIERAIVISTPDQSALAAEIARDIGGRAGIMYPGAAQHTPVEVTESALLAVGSVRADGCLAIGGGSTTGLSKAIAYRTDLPQLVVPTTFAGSEMTPILGETEAGKKTTLSSSKVLPETVIYDPDLTVTMPGFIAGPSGMNAIAHAVEALYAKNANPITTLMAEESIRALGAALPLIVEQGAAAKDAHAEALYGAWLAGICLGAVGMAIHHKICHTLGGMFNLNHADVHALMIPYTAAYNRDAAPDAMMRIARALNAEDGPDGIYDLVQRVATKRSLAEMGLTDAGLDAAADQAIQNAYYNPQPVTRDGVREMLQAAFEGRRP